jgi:cytochrome P450
LAEFCRFRVDLAALTDSIDGRGSRMSTMQHSLPSRVAPGPLELPLVGNPGTFRAARNLVLYCEEQRREYGDAARINLMGHKMTLLSHPDQIARVLNTERHLYTKGTAFDTLRRLLGDSLLTLDGSEWRGRRDLAQPAFHRQALEKLSAIMVESGALFFDRVLSGLHGQPSEFNAHRMMTHLTLDVVVSALFGRETINTSADVSFEDLGRALELVSDTFGGPPVPAWLPTPGNLKFKRVMSSLDRSVYKVIDAGKRRPNKDGTLLSMLLDARDEHGQALSSKALRDEVLTLFVAGHDTTALTLTWLLCMLDGRTDVQRRLEEEVDVVLGGREPTFADVPKLTYLRQVIDETMRLRPPAPMVARNALDDCEIGGFLLRKGEVAMPFIWGVHRHRDFWPDPERFDPERFAPGLAKARHNWSFLPFSGGPRICIGNTFSIVESVILLAQLFNRFDLKVLSGADVQPVAVGTVRPSAPIRIVLAPRTRKLATSSTSSSTQLMQ